VKRKYHRPRPLTPQIGSNPQLLWIIWILVAVIVLANLACKSGTDPNDKNEVRVTIDAVPLLLIADSTSTATIWATVTQGGQPVPDSTMVFFATSLGRIEVEAGTRDGLARATFTSGRETGVAAVIAQVKAVRDTVLVTLY